MGREQDVETHFQALKIKEENDEEKIKQVEEESDMEEWEQLEEQLDDEARNSQTIPITAQDSKKDNQIKRDKGYPKTTICPPNGSTNSLLLEGFPESFKTGDLIDLFDKVDTPPIIKWINDTSAIAVFSTSSIAKKAYLTSVSHPFITISPYTNTIMEQNFEAVRAERPTTTDMVARRLIAGALGVRVKQKTLQERESDSQKLDQARELRAERKREMQSRREASNSLFDS